MPKGIDANWLAVDCRSQLFIRFKCCLMPIFVENKRGELQISGILFHKSEKKELRLKFHIGT